jgi:hypothetical protein
MSKTKSYNQIIFLTTLSVYLGLVLVGASPQVLAQAALTSKFEIKDQIEKQDDLDKKPDQDVLNIAEALIEFSDDLRKLESIGKYKPTIDGQFSKSTDFTNDQEITQSIKNPWLEVAIEELFSKIHKKSFQNYPNIRFECNTYSQDFEFKISVEQKNNDVSNLTKEFLEGFEFVKKTTKNLQIILIYENTTVTAENNQVFIVTRLPRAAIDSLTNAKQ